MLLLDIYIFCLKYHVRFKLHMRDIHRRDERVAEYSFGAGPEIIENIDKRSSNKNDNEIVRCTMYLQWNISK